MRKIMIVTAMAVLGSIFTFSEAAAQYRSNHYGYRHHVAPRHYAPPVRHYHRPRHNWAPYAAGALALGALGGAYYYNRPTCWIETQDMFDRRGRYIGTQDVKVCH